MDDIKSFRDRHGLENTVLHNRVTYGRSQMTGSRRTTTEQDTIWSQQWRKDDNLTALSGCYLSNSYHKGLTSFSKCLPHALLFWWGVDKLWLVELMMCWIIAKAIFFVQCLGNFCSTTNSELEVFSEVCRFYWYPSKFMLWFFWKMFTDFWMNINLKIWNIMIVIPDCDSLPKLQVTNNVHLRY